MAATPGYILPPALHSLIFLGDNGKVNAYRLDTSPPSLFWKNELKGAGYGLTRVIFSHNDCRLFAAVNGHVFCLEPLSGNTVWHVPSANLPGISYGALVDLVSLDPTRLVVSGTGNVLMLSKANGSLIWRNDLPGKGYGVITLKVLTATAPFSVPGPYQAVPPPQTFVMPTPAGPLPPVPAPLPAPPSYEYAMAQAPQSSAPPMYPLYSAPAEPTGLYPSLAAPVPPSAPIVPPPQPYPTPAAPSMVYAPPPPPQSVPVYQPPIAILVGIRGALVALNPDTGAKMWDVALNGYTCVSVVHAPELGVLFAGMAGYIFKIDQSSGRLIQKINLVGSGYHPIGMQMVGGSLYAATWGYLYCIDPHNGNIVWNNELKGCGYAHGVSVLALPGGNIGVGINGKFAVLSPSGVLLKMLPLPGCRFAHVGLLLGPTNNVYAVTNSHCYNLSFNADLLWDVSSGMMGGTWMTISTVFGDLDLHSSPTFADYEETKNST